MEGRPAIARSVPSRTSNEQFSLIVDLLLRTSYFPRVCASKPIVRLFALPSILNGLFEHAVFVPQAIAHPRQLHRGHGIEKTSRQASEAPVTQTRVGFHFE